VFAIKYSRAERALRVRTKFSREVSARSADRRSRPLILLPKGTVKTGGTDGRPASLHGGRFASATINERIIMSAYVEFRNVKKTYRTGEVEIHALSDVNFEINKGEFCVIVGASGAGKTTILNILGGMDTLTSGSVFLDGTEISALNKKKLTAYRRYDVGFVFQFYNLVQNLTALENVELAAQICTDPLDAEKVLQQVGLGERTKNFPAQLSGGEQQRVAIARALAKNPKLLLCDEPTGALDYETGKAVLKLLQDTCRKNGMTVVVITHNQALTPMADRIITVKNGTVSSVRMNDNIVDIADIEW